MLGYEMFGRLVAGLIVAGLAFGVWMLWPRGGDEPATTTTVSTTTTQTPATTTTAVDETTTTGPAATSERIETVQQAEELLRRFWFGWFQGIYDQDEERIKEVVASQRLLDNARDQFGNMEFGEEPTATAFDLFDTEILRNDSRCTVIWSDVMVTFRDGHVSGAHVFRAIDRNWFAISIWVNPGDLWEQDCEAQLEPLS